VVVIIISFILAFHNGSRRLVLDILRICYGKLPELRFLTPKWLGEFEKKHLLHQDTTKEKEEPILEPKREPADQAIVNPPNRDLQQPVVEEGQESAEQLGVGPSNGGQRQQSANQAKEKKQQVGLDVSDEEQQEPGANLGQEKKKQSGSDTTNEEGPQLLPVELKTERSAGILEKVWWRKAFGNFRGVKYRGKPKDEENFGREGVRRSSLPRSGSDLYSA
jgi:hypothetical protein